MFTFREKKKLPTRFLKTLISDLIFPKVCDFWSKFKKFSSVFVYCLSGPRDHD